MHKRDVKCRKCGGAGTEVHHVFSRRHGFLRHHLSNLMLLCWRDHRFAHEKPLEFQLWAMGELGPENWELLEQARNMEELTLLELDRMIEAYREALKC